MVQSNNIERERCPKCHKPLPLTIMRCEGLVYISVYCKHCGVTSVIKVEEKK